MKDNTFLVASKSSHQSYRNTANLICGDEDCGHDINALMRFVPQVGGTVRFAPGEAISIGVPITITNKTNLTIDGRGVVIFNSPAIIFDNTEGNTRLSPPMKGG